MRRASVAVAATIFAGLALAVVPPARAFSLFSLLHNDDRNYDIKIIHVPELVALMHDRNAHVIIYDANIQDIRQSYGIIPGAKLLSSADDYDIASTLPADQHAKLVFYCTDLH